MVDAFALAVAHGLLVLAAIRLVMRDDLDDDHPKPRGPLGGRRAGKNPEQDERP
jgi:hypothetical protein